MKLIGIAKQNHTHKEDKSEEIESRKDLESQKFFAVRIVEFPPVTLQENNKSRLVICNVRICVNTDHKCNWWQGWSCFCGKSECPQIMSYFSAPSDLVFPPLCGCFACINYSIIHAKPQTQ